MNCFKELLEKFNPEIASENERLMFYAVCALITTVERQQIEIEGKEDRKAFYG